MARKLLIHAGQFKTGSSFLQSSIAGSADALMAAGICYPVYGDFAQAAKGRITSGNGGLVLNQDPDALIAALKAEKRPFDRVLLSNEFFSTQLFDEAVQARIDTLCAALDIDRVEVLLFTRNPVDHAVSEYQQHIKRAGRDFEVEEHLDRYRMPEQIARFLEAVEARDHYSVTVYNYSKVADDLIPIFETWLGLAAGTLIPPEVGRVNRSLSRSELEFQRALNTAVEDAKFFADALCEKLPEIEPEFVYPTTASQKAMLERLRDPLAYVNARVSADQAYDTEPVTDAAVDLAQYSFTADQLRVIAQAFGQRLEQSAASIAKLERALASEKAVSAHHIGAARLLRGKRDEAMSFFHMALQHNPRYLPSLIAVTRTALEDEAQKEEIADTLTRLIEVAPDAPETARLKKTYQDRFGALPAPDPA